MGRTIAKSFRTDDRAATAVEFALVAPVLLLFLLGILAYGGYFLMAHDVQELANDGARSAIAGIDATERATLAEGTVRANLAALGGLASAKTTVNVEETGSAFTVRVFYDATGSPYWALMDLLPMPSSRIARSATVTLGGY